MRVKVRRRAGGRRYSAKKPPVKNLGYYTAVILVMVIMLPLLIVRGCGSNDIKKTPEDKEKVYIDIYIKEKDKVEQMPLEEYIKGVVAAEMPAEFEPEALKAQAVAARTYAFGRMKGLYVSKDCPHKDAAVCTDPGHCQAWNSKQVTMKKWGLFSANKYWNKISRAVEETEGIVITYGKTVINPLFHSNSGGRTENVEEVWGGNPVPYLKSVLSFGEDESSEYKTTTRINIKDFSAKLKEEYPEIEIDETNVIKDIEILDYTPGERVKTIKIGNISLKGTEFRKIFQLKSAAFSIEEAKKGVLEVTTTGYGHGVGMSQWGAQNLAKNNYNYYQILKYYYQSTELRKIK